MTAYCAEGCCTYPTEGDTTMTDDHQGARGDARKRYTIEGEPFVPMRMEDIRTEAAETTPGPKHWADQLGDIALSLADALERAEAAEARYAALVAKVEALADEPLIRFAPEGDDIKAQNLRVLKHEAETPMRGHDPDGACCRRAEAGEDQ